MIEAITHYVRSAIFSDSGMKRLNRSIRVPNADFDTLLTYRLRLLAGLFGDAVFVCGWRRDVVLERGLSPILGRRGFDIVLEIGSDIDWTCWLLDLNQYGDLEGKMTNRPGLVVGLSTGWVQFMGANNDWLYLYPPPDELRIADVIDPTSEHARGHPSGAGS